MKKPKHTINSSLDSDPGFTIERDPSPEVLAAELDVPSAVLKVPVDLEMDLDDDQAKELVQAIADYLLRCGMGRPSLHDSRKKILTLGETFERAVKAIDDLRETKSILSLFTEEKGRSVWQLQKLRKRLNKASLATQKWAESIPQDSRGAPGKKPVNELVQRLVNIYNQSGGAPRGTGGVVSFIRLILEKCGEEHSLKERRIHQLVAEITCPASSQ